MRSWLEYTTAQWNGRAEETDLFIKNSPFLGPVQQGNPTFFIFTGKIYRSINPIELHLFHINI